MRILLSQRLGNLGVSAILLEELDPGISIPEPGERRQEGWTGSTGHFQGSETVLCGVMLADTRHHTCVKTHTMYNTENEP